MKYTKTITWLSFFLLSLGLNAQEVISSQGESYSSASGSIDFTIGEVAIDTGTDGTNDITQGFHQTNWNFVGLENQAPDYEVIIFPNPAEDVLNIRTTAFENLTYSLYDAKGKLVLKDELSAEQTAIQVSQLAPGNYSLILNKMVHEHQAIPLKTFNLIKTQ